MSQALPPRAGHGRRGRRPVRPGPARPDRRRHPRRRRTRRRPPRGPSEPSRSSGIDRDPEAVAAAPSYLAPLRRPGRRPPSPVRRRSPGGPRASTTRLGVAVDRRGLSGRPLRPRASARPSSTWPGGASPTGATPPLDMRMDPTSGRTAADVVNEYDEDALVELFADNGEGRFARRIARAIVAARPLATTGQLADVVRTAIPAATRRTGGHPARRVFQAIRIAVNEELDQLRTALDGALGPSSRPGGRCVVISYHSGEDRLVKSIVHPGGHRRLPLPTRPALRVRGRSRSSGWWPGAPDGPSAAEVGRNRRAEAARLRVIERLPAHPTRPRPTARWPDGARRRTAAARRARPQLGTAPRPPPPAARRCGSSSPPRAPAGTRRRPAVDHVAVRLPGGRQPAGRGGRRRHGHPGPGPPDHTPEPVAAAAATAEAAPGGGGRQMAAPPVVVSAGREPGPGGPHPGRRPAPGSAQRAPACTRTARRQLLDPGSLRAPDRPSSSCWAGAPVPCAWSWSWCSWPWSSAWWPSRSSPTSTTPRCPPPSSPRRSPVPAVRGGIYDRNGEVLAESVTKQTVVADPFSSPIPRATADALAPVLGLPADQLRSELTEHSGFVYLAHRVSDAVAAKVDRPQPDRHQPGARVPAGASPTASWPRRWWGRSAGTGTGPPGSSTSTSRCWPARPARRPVESPDGVALPGERRRHGGGPCRHRAGADPRRVGPVRGRAGPGRRDRRLPRLQRHRRGDGREDGRHPGHGRPAGHHRSATTGATAAADAVADQPSARPARRLGGRP